MLPLERHRLIVELLGQHGVMRVDEIAQATRVSRETVRRDLSELERKGVLNRSHGGALLVENPLPTPRGSRLVYRSRMGKGAFSNVHCGIAKQNASWPQSAAAATAGTPFSRQQQYQLVYGTPDTRDGVNGYHAVCRYSAGADEPSLLTPDWSRR